MFHILVTDDDKNTRLYFKAILERAGYTVTTAKDGEEALAVMDREYIDLVVLDVLLTLHEQHYQVCMLILMFL